MKILLLSAYDAESHRLWRERLRAGLPDCQFTMLVLPPRYFSWRIRGNALSWAYAERQVLSAGYDLLLATSMVDLATLRGLVPELTRIPTVVYFHENQFAYPQTAAQNASVEPQMVSLFSALAADRVVFNTEYNRSSFLDGLNALLRRLPDQVPEGLVDRLAANSRVIPVPVDGPAAPSVRSLAPSSSDRFALVWNHRWEYDKGPEKLLAAIAALPPDLPLTCHIVGQQFRREPAAFAELHQLLVTRGWLGNWGYLASIEGYHRLLANSHAVLSTALHDFQGLAVLEAVAFGCLPVVPDRLAYRELFAPQWRYASDYEPGVARSHLATDRESQDCANTICGYISLWLDDALPGAPDLQALAADKLAASYRELFNSVAGKGTK